MMSNSLKGVMVHLNILEQTQESRMVEIETNPIGEHVDVPPCEHFEKRPRKATSSDDKIKRMTGDTVPNSK